MFALRLLFELAFGSWLRLRSTVTVTVAVEDAVTVAVAVAVMVVVKSTVNVRIRMNVRVPGRDVAAEVPRSPTTLITPPHRNSGC